ncbi:response regulator transcription factor [Xylophilus sp. GW821-FHT01B05]
MNRVALVEDHGRLGALIGKALSGAGIEVDTFSHIDAAWHALLGAGYAAAIVDRGLPDGDGLDLVRRLRGAGQRIPCLMLTARDALHDRVAGLEAGADDYLPKPFAMEEMVARVRALMRRPPALRSLAPEYAGLRVLPEGGCMVYGDEAITLASAELQIMLSLVRAAGQTVRRTALEHAAWGLDEAVTPNALDVALHRLRKKLLAIGSPLQVANIRGHGYALRQTPLAA